MSNAAQKKKEGLQEKVRRRAYDSLEVWVKLVWNKLNPGTPLVWAPWMTAICEHLEAVDKGVFHTLLVNVPPGHTKTTICSIAYPLWVWGRNPEHRFIFGGWSNTNLKRDQRARYKIIHTDLYSWVFPRWREEVRIDPGNRGVEYFSNTVEGFQRKVSVQSQNITGAHGHTIIIDDPMPGSSETGAEAEIARRWWTGSMATRYTDLKNAKMICIMQRIRGDDLAGFFIDQGLIDAHICLPAEYDPKLDPGPTPLGWRDPRTKKGELLFPERFPLSVLVKKRGEMGPIRYAAQYQQAPAGGVLSLFQSDWWRYWDKLPSTKPERVIGVFDTSEGLSEDSDYTCGQVWYLFGDSYYLVDQIHARLDPSQLNHHGKLFVDKYPQAQWYVEKQSTGAAFIKHLQSNRVRVLPWVSRGSKQDRILSTIPYVEQGRIYLPLNAGCASELTAEATVYPRGRYDDQLDAMSIAIEIVKARLDSAANAEGAAVKAGSAWAMGAGAKRSSALPH